MTDPVTGATGPTGSAGGDSRRAAFEDSISNYKNKAALMRAYDARMRQCDEDLTIKELQIDKDVNGDRAIKDKDKETEKNLRKAQARKENELNKDTITNATILAAQPKDPPDPSKTGAELRAALSPDSGSPPSKLQGMTDDLVGAPKDYHDEATRDLVGSSCTTPEAAQAAYDSLSAEDKKEVGELLAGKDPKRYEKIGSKLNIPYSETDAAKTAAEEDSFLGNVKEYREEANEVKETVKDAYQMGKDLGILPDKSEGAGTQDPATTDSSGEHKSFFEKFKGVLDGIKNFISGEDRKTSQGTDTKNNAGSQLAQRAAGSLRTHASWETRRQADSQVASSEATAKQGLATAEKTESEDKRQKIVDLYKTDERIA